MYVCNDRFRMYSGVMFSRKMVFRVIDDSNVLYWTGVLQCLVMSASRFKINFGFNLNSFDDLRRWIDGSPIIVSRVDFRTRKSAQIYSVTNESVVYFYDTHHYNRLKYKIRFILGSNTVQYCMIYDSFHNNASPTSKTKHRFTYNWLLRRQQPQTSLIA